jgi:adenylate kinase
MALLCSDDAREGSRVPKPQAIVLVGPTGSGKTPLGNWIEAEGLWGRRCRHFDFGDNLRRAAEGACAAGLTDSEIEFIRFVLRPGALLEDKDFPVAEKILRAFLCEREAGEDELVVLNGLPRHVGQARDLEGIVEVSAVVELRCAEEAVRERIRSDVGGDRSGRADDEAESVRDKLDVFARRTSPMLEHYRRAGVRMETIQVAADSTAEDLWTELNGRAEGVRISLDTPRAVM